MDLPAQSTSICIPCGCTHSCKYCVSYLTCSVSKTQLKDNISDAVRDSLLYASGKSDVLIITARHGEPTMNMRYIESIMEVNKKFPNRFVRVEVQTNGSMLLDSVSCEEGQSYKTIIQWLKTIGVKTISLSLSSIFSSEENALANVPQKPEWKTDIDDVCRAVKDAGLILRLSLNMTDFYNTSGTTVFDRIKELQADQVTFRVLYNVGETKTKKEEEISHWITNHRANDSVIEELNNFIRKYGELRGVLPFGALQYEMSKVSYVVDDNCMDSHIGFIKNEQEKIEAIKAQTQLRYFVIENDGELYPNWNKSLRII